MVKHVTFGRDFREEFKSDFKSVTRSLKILCICYVVCSLLVLVLGIMLLTSHLPDNLRWPVSTASGIWTAIVAAVTAGLMFAMLRTLDDESPVSQVWVLAFYVSYVATVLTAILNMSFTVTCITTATVCDQLNEQIIAGLGAGGSLAILVVSLIALFAVRKGQKFSKDHFTPEQPNEMTSITQTAHAPATVANQRQELAGVTTLATDTDTKSS